MKLILAAIGSAALLFAGLASAASIRGDISHACHGNNRWCITLPSTGSTTSPTTVTKTLTIDASSLPTLKAVSNFVATTFQWRQCAADGTNCSDIAGATSSSYILPSNYSGSYRVVADGVTSGAWNLTNAPTPSGYYLREQFEGSIDLTKWIVQPPVGVNPGGSSNGTMGYVSDGFSGQAARFTSNAEAVGNANAGILMSDYTGNGASYVATAEGQSTWYLTRFRLPTGFTPVAGDWNWLVEWHPQTSTGAFASALGIQADGTKPGVGTNGRFLWRPGGGSAASPTLQYYYATPGSLQTNHWYTFVINIVWNRSSSVGRMSVWFDGIPFTSAAANGPSGLVWPANNSLAFPTLYTRGDGTADLPGFGVYNYHPVCTFNYSVDFDEVIVGPTAASIGFVPT